MNIKRIKDQLIKNKALLIIVLFIVFILFYIFMYKNISTTSQKISTAVKKEFISNKKSIFIGDTKILVDFADTKEKRIQGLSGREQLSSQEGMLFVFDKPDVYGFWMKDMKFNIDIIWINEDKEIIYFVENASPASFPETFMPPKKSLYVLEVQAGFVKKHNLKIGEKIDF